LFVTAKIHRPLKDKNKKGCQKDSNFEAISKTLLDGEERIVSCINFALLGDRGIFVNWLTTSNEKITSALYGKELEFLCDGGTWQRRHLALFLMKTVNLAVITHLRSEKLLNDDEYYILLQARADKDEQGHIFYNQIGFDEFGSIDNAGELEKEAFHGCGQLVTAGEKSDTDFIHFMYGIEELLLFKNSTGTFGKLRSFSERYKEMGNAYPDLKTTGTLASFSFPFWFKRILFYILSMSLEIFFLPFREDAEVNGFIEANSLYTDNCTTTIEERDIELLKDNKGWLNDPHLDFMTRW
jgi:hypothetical protein